VAAEQRMGILPPGLAGGPPRRNSTAPPPRGSPVVTPQSKRYQDFGFVSCASAYSRGAADEQISSMSIDQMLERIASYESKVSANKAALIAKFTNIKNINMEVAAKNNLISNIKSDNDKRWARLDNMASHLKEHGLSQNNEEDREFVDLIGQLLAVRKSQPERALDVAQELSNCFKRQGEPQEFSRKRAKRNAELEVELIKQQKKINELQTELNNEMTAKYLEVYGYKDSKDKDDEERRKNLVTCSVDLHFSDFVLKRDKMMGEKMKDHRDMGYKMGTLMARDLANITRIECWCTSKKIFTKAVNESNFLMVNTSRDKDFKKMTLRRYNYSIPVEKGFPFRRTVFVYGLQPGSLTDQHEIEKKLKRDINEAFGWAGKILNIVFSKRYGTVDQLIGMRLLEEENRVNKIYLKQGNQLGANEAADNELIFEMAGAWRSACVSCNKFKSDVFYANHHSHGNPLKFCYQCAAKTADEQSKLYIEKLNEIPDVEEKRKLKERLLGPSPHDTTWNLMAAKVIFESQRQASKCVYLRSRLAHKGIFCTHYHHYSKMKEEMSYTIWSI